jgi:hypothetical protein
LLVGRAVVSGAVSILCLDERTQTRAHLTSQRLQSSVTDSGSDTPISSVFLKGRNSMFGLRYARSAFVEAVFFFGGDSERKDDAGAGNEGALSENASALLRCASASASSGRPCRPFRRVAITTSFTVTTSFFGGDLSLVDRRVGETAAILSVAAFNRCEVVRRLRSARWRFAVWSISPWPASESLTATTQRAMSGPCLHGGRACRRSNTASSCVRLEEYRAIAMSGGEVVREC